MSFITNDVRATVRQMIDDRDNQRRAEIEGFCNQENLNKLVRALSAFVTQEYVDECLVENRKGKNASLAISCVQAKIGSEGMTKFGITDYVVKTFPEEPKNKLLEALQHKDSSVSDVSLNAAFGVITITFDPPLT